MKKNIKKLIASIAVIVLLIILLVYFSRYFTASPKDMLSNYLEKQPNVYNIYYELKFETNSPPSIDKNTLDVYYSKDSLKVISYFLTEDRAIDTDKTQYYFELPQGDFLCLSQTGRIVCNPYSVQKDPISQDRNLMPTIRINMILENIDDVNLKSDGEKDIINRKCSLFNADLRNLESFASDNLRYLREVYKTEPSKMELGFCLDKNTGIPLEMVIDMSYYTTQYGEQNVKITYRATVLNFDVKEEDFELPV